MTKLYISEIFLSLQGEGLYAGEPTCFVRLQGCNLFVEGRCCKWCDTAYAQGLGGQEMEVEEIVSKVRALAPLKRGWVCITGGEPLNQVGGLKTLVEELGNWEYRTEIETNGTLPKPYWYRLVDSWSADIKCPSSGVESLVDGWFGARREDQLKFVVGTKEDLEYAKQLIENRARKPTVLVSPVADSDGNVSKEWLQVVWQFCIEERTRFSYQLHKLAFGNKKGT